jgi:predicted HTH domain antitoxin
MINVTLPKIMEREINALIEGGYYPDKSEIIKDAFKSLLESKADLRISAAVEMYKNREISFGRAAEISGLSTWEFENILKDRGVKIVVEAPSKDETAKQIELMKH